ncbi:hypothetical protein [Haliscomenobacter sp.]|uniref:hypothetical protein n=1 Tax=Haliscomenobacter sp. TaxID=2717303 RepID=UPI0035932D25
MKEQKNRIIKDIVEGDLNKAFEALIKLLPPEMQNDLILLAAQYNFLEKKVDQGVTTFTEAGPDRSRITQSLLKLLDQFQEGGQNFVEQAVLGLGIEADNSIGEISLYNCNRKRITRRFKSDFNDKRNSQASPFYFYFICGCRDERPESFARRLVYEVLCDDLNMDSAAAAKDLEELVFFPFRVNGERISIKPLPFSDGNLGACKNMFKKAFEERLGTSLESFLQNGLPRLNNFKYIITIFKTNSKNWEDDEGIMNQYFKWLLDTFSNLPPGTPEFLFFIVIDSPGLWKSSEMHTMLQRNMLADLQHCCGGNEKMVLADLLPVDQEDLFNWFYQLDGLADVNPNKIHDVIDAIVQTLNHDERNLYKNEQKIHMKDIEPMQQNIFDLAKR